MRILAGVATTQFALLVSLAAILLSLYPSAFTVVSSASAALSRNLISRFRNYSSTTTPAMATNSSDVEPYWLENLRDLPATPENIPAFFFAHGSPMLAFDKKDAAAMGPFGAYLGPSGPLARFLEAFGPTLLQKYKPKGIVVFSAHWETHGTRLGEFAPLAST